VSEGSPVGHTTLFESRKEEEIRLEFHSRQSRVDKAADCKNLWVAGK